MENSEGPYPGSRAFDWADRDRFFGRRTEIDAIADSWRSSRLTIVYGPIGSGRTSLLRAGILPKVKSGAAEVLPVGQLSSRSAFPDAAFPDHNPYTLTLLTSWAPREDTAHLVGRTVRDFMRHFTDHNAGSILAAIDNVEDLFWGDGQRPSQRCQFLEDLTETMRQVPGLHVMLSVREVALAPIVKVLGNGAQHRVVALSHKDAVEAITGPLDGTSRFFAPKAAEKLVADLAASQSGTVHSQETHRPFDRVEPALLQAVCAQLWRSLPPGLTEITENDVRRYGNVDAALAVHCGRIIARVADSHDLPAARVRSWLVSTFVTDIGTRGRVHEGMTRVSGMPVAVARALADQHLLSVEQRAGARWYELLSDCLVEPLQHATEELPPAVGPREYLRSASRAVALAELDLAERHARESLRALSSTDFHLCAEAYSLLGNIANERGIPFSAEVAYREAARYYEAARDTEAVAFQLVAVGQMLIAQGQVEAAIRELRAAAERMPHEPVVQTELSWALWQLGDRSAAVAVLTGILGVDGGNPAALRARGEILADLGQPRAALRDLDRVMPDDHPSTRAARGLAYAELGENDVAGKEIESALADAPHNGHVLLYAARAEALGGRDADAADLARRAALASDPALPPYQRKVAFMLADRHSTDSK